KSTQYKTVELGYDEVPRQLCRRFHKNGGEILLYHRLKSFDRHRKTPGVDLTFHAHPAVKTPRIHAERLILAMPRRALELIEQSGAVMGRKDLQKNIRSVTPVNLFKMFVTYPGPWWRATGVSKGRSVTDLPVRQCYYWGTEGEQPWGDPKNRKSVLLATY